MNFSAVQKNSGDFDPVEFRRRLEEIRATTKPLSQEEVEKLLSHIKEGHSLNSLLFQND